ncbi:hypothetical protein Q6249_27940, partial [Klebsiella pneumoniae]
VLERLKEEGMLIENAQPDEGAELPLGQYFTLFGEAISWPPTNVSLMSPAAWRALPCRETETPRIPSGG